LAAITLTGGMTFDVEASDNYDSDPFIILIQKNIGGGFDKVVIYKNQLDKLAKFFDSPSGE